MNIIEQYKWCDENITTMRKTMGGNWKPDKFDADRNLIFRNSDDMGDRFLAEGERAITLEELCENTPKRSTR